MPYETGVSTTETDLIQKLLTFLLANGWTQDHSAVDGTGWRIHVHKGDQFIALETLTSNSVPYTATYHRNTGHHLGICGHDSYSGAAAWNAQPGTSEEAFCGDLGGPHVAYYFFLSTDCDTLYCVVECTTGVFRHFGFGKLVPIGTTTETLRWVAGGNLPDTTTPGSTTGSTWLVMDGGCGAYQLGEPGQWVRLNLDGSDAWRRNTTYTSSAGRVQGIKRGNQAFGEAWLAASPSTWNTTLPLTPEIVFVVRSGPLWSPLGYQKGLVLADITGYVDGAEVVVGGKTWKVFPGYQRGSSESGSYGLCYCKEA